jgi:cyclase
LRYVSPQFGGLGAFARCRVADHLTAVRREYCSGQEQFGIFQRSIRPDRHLASSAKFRKHRAFRGNRQARPRIVERKRCFKSGALLQRLNRQRALADGGANDVGAENLADDVAPSKSSKSRSRKHDGVVLAALDLANTGIYIAADVLDFEIRPDAPKLGDAPKRAGSHFGAEFDVAQFAADDGIARIGPLRKRGDGEAFGKFGGQVLQAMHREVNALVEQSFFDLACEEAFTRNIVKRRVQNAIAGGLDDFDAALRTARLQTLPDVIRLPERKLRTPGPDHQHDPSVTTAYTPSAHALPGDRETDIVSKMTRKLLVRGSAALFLVFIGWEAYVQGQATPPPPLTLNKVKDNLYEIEGDGGNVAVYVTSEGVILVDDKYDQDFDHIMEKIKSVTNLPVKYVLSTHYHSDHSGGNAKLLPTAEVISTANARTNIVEHKQANAQPNMQPARVVFTVESSVFLGGKEVRAHYYGRGHTNGDAVIYFPAEKVMHTGDLMAGNTPLIDYPGGGSLADWPNTLDQVLKVDFETVIPGHGPVTNKAALKAYRDSVEKEKNRTTELIRQGKSQAEVGKAMIDEFHWTANGLQMQWSLPGMMTELK